MRWKWIIIVTGVVLVVLMAAAYIVVESFDFNRYKPAIERIVQDATGRELVIGGDIDVDLGLATGVAFGDVRMQNAPWGQRPDWLNVKEIQIKVSLLPLLSGILAFKSITLLQPDILIESQADGRTNLTFEAGAPGGDRASKIPFRSVTVREILIQNGRLSYRDVRLQHPLELELNRFGWHARDIHSPVELDAGGTLQKHRFHINGQITNPMALWQMDDRTLALDLTLRALACDLSLVGKIEDLSGRTRMAVKVESRGSGIRDILEIADLAELPDPGPFRLTGEIRGPMDGPALENLTFRIGDPERLECELNGGVADLATLAGVDLSLEARGEEFSRMEEYVGRPIAMKGPFELRGRIARKPSQGYRIEDFYFTVGPNDIAATADIDLSGARPDVKVDVTSRHLNLQPFFQTATAPPPSDRQPGSVSATDPALSAGQLLELADVELKMQAGNIELPEVSFKDLTIQAALADSRVDFEIEAPAVPDLEALTGLTRMSDLGAFRIAGSLQETDRRLNLVDLRGRTGRPASVEVEVTGALRDLLTHPELNLDFRLEGDDAAELEKYIAEPWPLQGPFRLTGRMVTGGPVLFRFGNLRGVLHGVDFSGSVKVDASGKTPVVLTAVSAARFNLKPLSLPALSLPEALRERSDLGPLKAEIKIAVADGTVRFDAVRIQAGRPDLIAAALNGRVADVGNLQGVDAHLTVRGDELQSIKNLVGQPIPVQGPFELDTDIKTPAAGSLHFQKMAATLGPNRFSADILLDTRPPRPKLTAALAVQKLDLRSVAPQDPEGSSLKEHFTSTVLQERLIFPSVSAPDWLMENDADIEFDVDQLSISRFTIQALKGQFQLQNGDIRLRAEGNSFADIQDVSPMSGRFDIGRTELQVRGATVKQKLAVQAIRLNAGNPETVELNLEGTVTDAVRQRGLDVRFVLNGEDSDILNNFLALPKPLEGPFRVSGHLVDPKLSEYRLEDFQLVLGDSDLTGWVDIDLASRRPRIAAEFASRRLDLRHFTGDADMSDIDASDPKGRTPKPAVRSQRVFSDDPLPLDWLDRLDLQIRFECRQFYSKVAAVDDLTLKFDLENGDLTLKPFQFTTGQGSVSGHLTVQTRNDVKTAAVFLEVEDYDIAKELSRLGLARELEGTVDARIDVAGPAESVAAFMGQLNGRIVVSLAGGRIQEKYIGLLYSDLRSTLLKLINPLGGKEPFVDLNCFVNTFQVQNGLAGYAAVLDTPQTTLFGAGTVNLKTERLDVTLKSNTKEGLKLGSLGRIGFSLSDLTKPFKLGGTLARPSLEVDPAGTVFAFGKILGGVLALGPAGIAVIFTDVSLDADNPCAQALLDAQKDLKND
jgi:uncharacterized protein involved in outer membrane biogenesis